MVKSMDLRNSKFDKSGLPARIAFLLAVHLPTSRAGQLLETVHHNQNLLCTV